MEKGYNLSVNFSRLSDAEITNLREEIVLRLSAQTLKKVSEKQRERIAVLNPAVHILIEQYRGHALTYPKYNDTVKVGEV